MVQRKKSEVEILIRNERKLEAILNLIKQY